MLLDNLPIAVVACGADGAILRFNRKAAELFGRKPIPGERFDTVVRLLKPDGKPLGETDPITEALRTGQSQRDLELLLDQPSGRRVRLLANVEPMTSGGAATGAIGSFIQFLSPYPVSGRTMGRGGTPAAAAERLSAVARVAPIGRLHDRCRGPDHFLQ